jgi:PPOX class probable F420-dependent enzyme
MSDLTSFVELLSQERFLAVLITTRLEHTDPQVSVVNAAVIDHPSTGHEVVAFVGRTGSKLRNLRRNPRATLVARAGWEWSAVAGSVELIGPDDPHPATSDEARSVLLRHIYHAAGGRHPDLDAYDEAMRVERRCAVLLTPERVWTNPPGSEHLEPNPDSESLT